MKKKTKSIPGKKRAAKTLATLDDLLPDDRNANRGTERGSTLIRRSLKDYGAGRSVLADKDGRLIAGNKTVENARAMGMDKIRVVQTDGSEIVVVQRTDLTLNDRKARELALVDNRAGQVSLEWDVPAVESIAADFGIELGEVGFAEGELDAIEAAGLDGEGLDQEVTEDEVPDAADVEKRCNPGDLWQLGDHFLLCGDCRESADVATLLGQAKVNLAVTSPPYASQRKYDESSGFEPIPPDEYVGWWEAVQENVKGRLTDDGSFFVNIKPHCEDGQRVLYVNDMVAAMVRRWGWMFVDELCWKRAGVPGGWTNRFKNGWEPVFHFSTSSSIKFRPDAVSHETEHAFDYSRENGKSVSGSGLLGKEHAAGFREGMARPSNVVEVGSGGAKVTGMHEAEYPVGLPSWFINAFTDPGDVVFEPFCGSGTTLIASEQLGRRCFATEISPKYCDVIIARWEKLTGKKAKRLA